ncbi:MAG: aspartate aminotransferase family protein, partial [Verrucomicrobia bacterium]|nr:aspartate aminotransferase family protein [Verrucomicrobiota bacterium]
YKGLFSVIEFVKDRETKEPLAPYGGTSPEMVRLAAYLKAHHIYAFSRFNMLWICPPLVVKRDELDYGLNVIENGLELVHP